MHKHSTHVLMTHCLRSDKDREILEVKRMEGISERKIKVGGRRTHISFQENKKIFKFWL